MNSYQHVIRRYANTHTCHNVACLRVCLFLQVQHGAGLAAAVALLRPLCSQPASPQIYYALPGLEGARAAGLRLSAAAAELAQVRARFQA